MVNIWEIRIEELEIPDELPKLSLLRIKIFQDLDYYSFFIRLDEQSLNIEPGETRPVKIPYQDHLNINLQNEADAQIDILRNSSSINHLSAVFLNGLSLQLSIEKKYLYHFWEQPKMKNHDGCLQFSSHRELLSFLLLFYIDEVLSLMSPYENNQGILKNFMDRFTSSFVGNFLIKRMLYYKYRDFKDSDISRKSAEDYYSLLLTNKLETYYSPDIISEGKSFWFPHPETEIIKLLYEFD